MVVARVRSLAYGFASTAAYDALAIEFYADLPDDVAAFVSQAYAVIHSMERDSSGLAEAHAQIAEGFNALKRYAKTRLKLKYLPEEPITTLQASAK